MTRASSSTIDESAARREIAPIGRLRVGVVFAPAASPFFVMLRGDDTPEGVTVDLGIALAAQLQLPIDFLVVPNSGELTDAVEAGAVDVAFMPIDEQRKQRVDFGPAYFLAESTCLVREEAAFRTNADLDRPGVRVVGIANTTTIRSAERLLKSATVIAAASVTEAIDMFRQGKADAFALSRDSLRPYCREIAGVRILDGHLQTTGVAIAVPKNRPLALAYASAFLEEAKRSGLIRRAFDKAGLQLDQVAP
jgi:polar amino acid transport system substrate-binding protein